MKEYFVKALKPFHDKLENKNVSLDDTFYCTKERYEFLKGNNAVELIGIQKNIDDAIKENVEEKKESKNNIEKKITIKEKKKK